MTDPYGYEREADETMWRYQGAAWARRGARPDFDGYEMTSSGRRDSGSSTGSGVDPLDGSRASAVAGTAPDVARPLDQSVDVNGRRASHFAPRDSIAAQTDPETVLVKVDGGWTFARFLAWTKPAARFAEFGGAIASTVGGVTSSDGTTLAGGLIQAVGGLHATLDSAHQAIARNGGRMNWRQAAQLGSGVASFGSGVIGSVNGYLGNASPATTVPAAVLSVGSAAMSYAAGTKPKKTADPERGESSSASRQNSTTSGQRRRPRR